MPTEDSRNALLILPHVGSRPTCIDPEEPTPEEEAAVLAWEERRDNFRGLKALVTKHDWLFEGEVSEMIHEDKGVLVSHPAAPGELGMARFITLNRVLRPNPRQWFLNKVTLLRQTYTLRGYLYESLLEGLADRGYLVEGER